MRRNGVTGGAVALISKFMVAEGGYHKKNI